MPRRLCATSWFFRGRESKASEKHAPHIKYVASVGKRPVVGILLALTTPPEDFQIFHHQIVRNSFDLEQICGCPSSITQRKNSYFNRKRIRLGDWSSTTGQLIEKLSC